MNCRIVSILVTLTATALAQNPFAGRYEGPLTTTTLGQIAEIGQVVLDVNDAGDILSQEGTALFLRGLVSDSGAVSLEGNLFQLSTGQIVNDILTSTSNVNLPFIGDQITTLTLSRTGPAGGSGGNGTLPDPGVVGLASFRDRLGETLQFEVTANPVFPFYGGDVYTDNSPLASTVVHAGLLAAGETGIVSVTILSSPDSYPASEQNGVTSGFWPIATEGAYTFSGTPEDPELPDNVTTIMVDAKASGQFGSPTSAATPFVKAYEFGSAGEAVAIVANGNAIFGEGLNGGPNGVTTARDIISGYTPLEEAELDSGAITEAALPAQAPNVGALIGAFIPANRTSAPGFQPNDADTLTNGIESEDLFLVGSISAFIAPEPGTLFLGINEAWMANNSGSFQVLLGEVESEPTTAVSISQDANGPFIEWSGEATLRQSTNMIDWNVIDGATSPYRFNFDGARYFQLEQ